MGTRSIILITGNGEYLADHITVRLYKHWDGYPAGNLSVILNAIRAIPALQKDRGDRPMEALPALTMADLIMAHSITWSGAGAVRDDSWEEPWFYTEPIKKKHFFKQSDLEWVYVVDITRKTIMVYSDGHGVPMKHIGNGPVNPVDYTRELGEDYKEQERLEVERLVQSIEAEGWHINPADYSSLPKTTRRAAKAVKKHE